MSNPFEKYNINFSSRIRRRSKVTYHNLDSINCLDSSVTSSCFIIHASLLKGLDFLIDKLNLEIDSYINLMLELSKPKRKDTIEKKSKGDLPDNLPIETLGDKVFRSGILDTDNKLHIGHEAIAQFRVFLQQAFKFDHTHNFNLRRLDKDGVYTYEPQDYSNIYYDDDGNYYRYDLYEYFPLDNESVDLSKIKHRLSMPLGLLDALDLYGKNFIIKLAYSEQYSNRDWRSYKPYRLRKTLIDFRTINDRKFGRPTKLTVDHGNTFKNVNGSKVGACLPSDKSYGFPQGASTLPTLLSSRLSKVSLVEIDPILQRTIEKQSTRYIEFSGTDILIKNRLKNLPHKLDSTKWNRDLRSNDSYLKVDKSKLAFKGKLKTKCKINWGTTGAKLTPTIWQSRSYGKGKNTYFLQYDKTSNTVFYMSSFTSYPIFKVLSSNDGTRVNLHLYKDFNLEDIHIFNEALSFIGAKRNTSKDYYDLIEHEEQIRLGLKSEHSSNVLYPEVKSAVRYVALTVDQYAKELEQDFKDRDLKAQQARSREANKAYTSGKKIIKIDLPTTTQVNSQVNSSSLPKLYVFNYEDSMKLSCNDKYIAGTYTEKHGKAKIKELSDKFNVVYVKSSKNNYK